MEKKLAESPPATDPRGMWLEADIIQRGEAKGPPTPRAPTARSAAVRLQLDLGGWGGGA